MFICSTTSNLNNFKPQQLQPQKRVQSGKKKQNRRPEPRKHTKNPRIAPLFFCTMRLFETFWIAPKGPPFIFFSFFCNQLEFHKARRVPPFQFWALDMAPILAVLGLLFISAIAGIISKSELCNFFQLNFRRDSEYLLKNGIFVFGNEYKREI